MLRLENQPFLQNLALKYVTVEEKGRRLGGDIRVCSRKIMVTERWKRIAENGLELLV